MKKILFFVFVAAALFTAAAVSAAPAAAPQDTCPEGGGWVKVDGLSGLSYTFAIPDGYEVIENCMKVGNHDPLFGTGNIVENTTLFNSPQGVTCTAPGVPHQGCALQKISHASFLIAPIVSEECPQGDYNGDLEGCGEEPPCTEDCGPEEPPSDPPGGRPFVNKVTFTSLCCDLVYCTFDQADITYVDWYGHRPDQGGVTIRVGDAVVPVTWVHAGGNHWIGAFRSADLPEGIHVLRLIVDGPAGPYTYRQIVVICDTVNCNN
jgi:hypothetical protein